MTGAGLTSTSRRVVFGTVLTLAMAVGPYVVYALGALGPLLTEDLRLTRTALGVLSTVNVAIGCVAAPFLGSLVDRWGGRRLCGVLFSSSMLGLAAFAGAPTFPLLVVAMVVAGLALSLIDPVTNWLVGHHLPPARQGRFIGIKQSGVQIGALIAGAALPALGAATGWRGAIAASMVLPATGLALALWVLPGDPPRAHAGRRRAAGRLGPTVAWTAGYAFFMGAGLAPVSTYLPLFAHERAGMSPTAAGATAAVIAGVGVVSRIGWGYRSEHLRSTATTLAVLGAASVVATTMLWLGPAAGSAILWSGAVLFGASAGSWHAVGMVGLVRHIRAEQAGRAAGAVQMCFYLGFLATPPVFGLAVDRADTYAWGWAAVAALFVGATALAVAWRRAERSLGGAPADRVTAPRRGPVDV